MSAREKAYKALEALRPAPVFLEAYRTKRLPENLQIYFGPPEEFFLAPDTESAYTEGGLIPILDDGNFGLLTFFDPSTKSLIQKDVESPHEVQARFSNWQQYLASVVIQIAESVEDDEGLRKIAELLQFKYLEETLGFLTQMSDGPYEQYCNEKRMFISGLTD